MKGLLAKFLIGRLEDLMGAAKCELCGTDQWTIPTNPEDQTASRLGLSLEGGDETVYFFAMTCDTCGNTKFLHTNTLMKAQEETDGQA